jgi:hypothetical protein
MEIIVWGVGADADMAVLINVESIDRVAVVGIKRMTVADS